jgi:hypothetical protein
MESRKCFTCQVEKPLSDFTPNRRKYQIKKYLGMLLNCDECILYKTSKNKGTVWFNFDINKFEVHNLETEDEILLFFDDKLSKFKK